ncbi:MAG: hypothetical protein ACKPJJ_23405 [Planctomycetaceae bacterium]
MTVAGEQYNPFAAPAIEQSDEVLPNPADPTDFTVRDEILICGPRLLLPAVCWKTGLTEDLEPVQFRVQRASFRLQTSPVEVQTFISRQRRKQEERRGIRLSLLAVVGVLMIVLPLLFNSPGLTGVQVLWRIVVMLAGIIITGIAGVLMTGGLPVVQRYRAPGLHYVRGLPSALLAQLRLVEAKRRRRDLAGDRVVVG